MKKYTQIVIAASSLLGVGNVLAGTMGPVVNSANEWVVTLGGFGIYQGESQYVPIPTLVGNTYEVTNHRDGGFLAGLGYFRSLPTARPTQIGINAYYLSPTSVDGTVLQENQFINLNYSYDVTHVPVYAMVKTALLASSTVPVMLNAGIGPNFQIIRSYQETPLDGITIPDNAFKGDTKATFSATAGVSASLGSVLGKGVECGYQFMYLGNGQLKSNNTQILDNMKTGSAYANVGFCAAKF